MIQATYKQLMNSFHLLASDLSRVPEVAKLWLGMVAQAKHILNDFSRSRMQEELLGLSEKAKVATTSVANSNSTASEELSKFSVKPGKQVNDTAIPVKRLRKEKSRGESHRQTKARQRKTQRKESEESPTLLVLWWR